MPTRSQIIIVRMVFGGMDLNALRPLCEFAVCSLFSSEGSCLNQEIQACRHYIHAAPDGALFLYRFLDAIYISLLRSCRSASNQ